MKPSINRHTPRLWSASPSQVKARHLVLLVFILAQLFFVTSLVFASGTLSLDVSIVDPTTPTVQTGQIVEYLIDFSCSSTSMNCGTLTINFTLDTELDFIEAIAPPGYNWTYNPVTRVLTIVNNPLINPTFDDGEAGQVTVRARVGQNLSDLQLNATVNGTITNGPGGNPITIPVPGPTLTILTPNGGWTLDKSKVSPADPVGPASGGQATYQLRACPGTTGVARMDTISFVDRFPEGAVPVAPLPTGATIHDELPAPSGNGINDTIRWTVDVTGTGPGGLWTANDGCITQTYTVEFPAAAFPPGTPINNTAYFSYVTPDGYPPVPGPCPTSCAGTDGNGTTSSNPVANLQADKDGPGTSAVIAPGLVNGTSVFTLNWNLSQANASVSGFIVQDIFPTTVAGPVQSIIDVQELGSGTWPGGHVAQLQTFDGTTWTTRATVNGSSNVVLTPPGGFPAGIRGMRLVFTGPVPPGFAPVTRPSIRFIIPDGLDPANYDQDGPGPLKYRDYNNCLTFSGTVAGGTFNAPGSVCEAFRVGKDNTDGFANILVSKTSSPSEVFPLEEITFTLTLSLTQEASSNLINPVIEDVLPFGMQALRVTGVNFSANMTPSEQVFPYVNIDTVTGTHPITAAPVSLQRLRFYWRNTPFGGSNYDLDSPAGSETFANPVPPTYNFSLIPDDDGAPVTGNPISIARPATGAKTITIQFVAMPRLDTPSGDNGGNQFVYANTTRTVANSPNLVCQSGMTGTDSGDIDGDGNTTETRCDTTGNYRIREAAQMSSQKWIRSVVGPFGFLDATNLNNPSPSCPIFTYDPSSTPPNTPVNYTRYPCVAQAVQGGAIEYLMRIQNSGLVNVNEFILYDVLSHVGDVGVSQATAGQPRFSEFRTFLTGPIVLEAIAKLPTGWPVADTPTFVIEYNEVTPHNNSCRPEMSNTATITPADHWQPGCNNTWVTTPSSWGAVTSFRIRQTGGLVPPGAELIFSAPAIVSNQTIPGGWEAETGEIAWNNFAQRFRNAPSGRRLLTAEPRKVGVIVPEVYSIGNRVWIDNGGGAGGIAGDGILNGTEAGINGVEVQLWTRTRPNPSSPYGAWSLFRTDTTRADTSTPGKDGFYFFGNLPGGINREYRVLIPHTQFSPGPDNTYGTLDDAILATYISSNYTGVDASGGAYQASQSNARLDQRDNGVNPGTFAGYTNATTGGDGFPNGGVRTQTFQLTRGQTSSLSTQGDQSTADNANANVNLDNTNPDAGPQRNEGQFGRGQDYERNDYSDLTRDFGFFTPMSIGNRVWRDDGRDLSAPNNFNQLLFNNGIQDGDELGIAGVQVRLQRDINLDGDFDDPGEGNFANTTTDANGYYIFDGLPPGNYRVLILNTNFTGSNPLAGLLSSYSPTAPVDAAPDRNDHGIDNANPAVNGILSPTITLQPPGGEPTGETDLSGNASAHGPLFRGRNGELDANSDLTVDFGFIAPLSIGNRVWIDDGRIGPGTYNPAQFDDGILNGAELGVQGVTVRLYFASNLTTPIATTTTDANGYYLFQYLPPGDYVVEIPSSNFVLGGPLYLHFSSTSVPAPVDATPNDRDHGIDVADPTVSPVRSPVIQLRPNQEPTNEDPANPTTNTGIGLGVFTGTGQPIRDSDSDLTVDFGFVRPVAIGNRVWLDDNSVGQLPGDGIRQATEVGINGVTVQLYLQGQTPGVDTPIASTVTANGGYYLFDRKGNNQADPNAARLGLGNYFVHIPASNFTGSGPLVGYINSDNGPATNGGDTGIDSVTGGGDENGQNTLVPTNPATYPTVTGVSSSIIQLGYDVEPLNEVDRDPTRLVDPDGRSVNDGSSDLTIDFGFYRPRMSIGNRVWLDNGAGGGLFGNGVQDGTEPGIANVVVNLYRDDDNNGVPDTAPGSPLASTTTDSNGYYIFDGLLPGRYIVTVAASNFASGGPLFEHGSSIGNYSAPTTANTRDDRRDNGIDNPNPTINYGVISHSVNLTLFGEPTNEAPGDLSGNPAHGPGFIGNNAEVNINSNMTIDFGFVRYMSLGNRVWLDDGAGGGTRNDGIQNGAEVGIDGVTVELYRDDNNDGVPDGPAIATTTTSGGGYYLFDGLFPGLYIVGIPASNFTGSGVLVGYDSSYDGHPTQPNLPTNDGVDRNDNGIDAPNPPATGVISRTIELAYDTEPTSETDLQTANPSALPGPNSRGRNNEANANSDLTIDFGFFPPRMSLGNRVWFDDGAGGGTRNNGLQDGAELGVANVVVNLYRDVNNDGQPDEPAASPFRTTTTDSNGYYIFDDLSPGRYIVTVAASNFTGSAPLAGFGSSTGNYSAPTTANTRDDRRDNGIDPVDYTTGYGVRSHVVTLTLYQEPTNEAPGDLSGNPAHGPGFIGNNGEFNANSNMTIDFGFVRYMSLGNRVWLDNGAGGGTRNDGIQNGAEPGIDGVTVQLFAADGAGNPTGPVLQTATTSGGGYYLFDGLFPGDYVVVIPASNFTGSGALVNFNSSYDGTGGNLLDNGVDRNDNGIDENLPAVNGVRSRAINLAYDAEPTSETDLQAPNPSALPGPNSRGRNNEANANSELTVDFGFVEPRYSLGNFVWYDYNNNGQYDTGFVGPAAFRNEAPAPGVTVRLYFSSGNDTSGRGIPTTPLSSPFRTTTTDANGYYLFDDLPAGNYVIWIDALNFRSVPTPGPLFEYRSSTDVYSAPTVSNARLDTRDNGVDEANPVVNGVYSTTISVTKNALPIGEPDLSSNPTHGPAGERRGNFGQLDSDSDLTRDFSFFKFMSIGNRVWLDPNNNGIVDAGESGIAGVTVQLWEDTDLDGTYETLRDTRLTNATGHYLFDGLLPGDYLVVIPASNFSSGGALDGLNSSNYTGPDNNSNGAYAAPTTASRLDNRDNGFPPTIGPFVGGVTSSPIQLRIDSEPTGETDLASGLGANGETNRNSNLTIDFGFVGDLLSLGNRVWLDPNNNGQQDTGENGIANVRVSLYRDVDNNGIPDGPAIQTTLTDANGYYLFDNLPPGRYIVGLDNSNFGPSQPLNGLISSTYNGPSSNDGGYNAPTVSNARNDRLDNGRDTLNPTFGLLSHTIELARTAEPVGETDIGPQGIGAGGQDNSSNLTIDFGLFRPLSIGNRVWLDNGGGALTNNGLQDAIEVGIAGVELRLYRYIGTNPTPTDYTTNPGDYTPVLDALSNPRTSTTDANGYYLFDGLGQGIYVVVVAPSNFAPGGPLENFNNSTPTFATPADRNDNGINNPSPATLGIASNPVTLTVGGAPTGETDLSGNTVAHGPNSRGRNGETDNNSNLTIDFGFVPTTTLSLGNRVWIDEGPNGRNGVLDAGESGAANVRVSLYFDSNNDGAPDGPAIATTITDANGYYLFDNLAPGRYIVGLDASNFVGSGPLVGYGSSPYTGPSSASGAYNAPPSATRDDNRDNGIDNPAPNLGNGIISHSILLQPGNQSTVDSDVGPQGTGAGGVDANSNLTIDFGLYRPLSIGNRVWLDNGPAAQTNNGLQDPGELGIAGVIVELYAADTTTGQRIGSALATTITDANGYYIFDGLLPGSYVVFLPTVNFTGSGPLVGMTNSVPTNPNPLTGEQNVDRNDNGINDPTPAVNGIASNMIVLAYNTMPTNETDLSGNTTAHGPNSRGRNGEANNNSNLTVDFGFFVDGGTRMSLGNRVWLDNGAGGGTANDGTQNGAEPGVDGVTVELYADADGNGVPDSLTPLASTVTTGDGYYLFDNLLPGRYVVVIPASNFDNPTDPLYGTLSSTGAYTSPSSGPRTDQLDNGVDVVNPAVSGVRSGTIQLVLGNETTGETDLGPQGTGLDANGNPIADNNSNLTIDFGFVTRFDWGDAPDTGGAFTFPNGSPANYGTSNATGGPSHRIVSGLYMGSRVDAENDGQPNAPADGDDVNGTPDDEDGVVFPPLVAGLPAPVQVTVFNNTGQPATLVGWIDFNGNGVFDASEAVSATVPSSTTPQVITLTFTVPAGSDLPAQTGGTTYARFRLSTDPTLTTGTPGGPVNDGEVEDYRVTIQPPGVYINKTDGLNSIVVGQSTTYTVTIRNSPSNSNTITGRPFTDTLDSRFINVSWTCVANNLASCVTGQGFGTGASGTGNIALSLDLAPGGEIIITINATLQLNVVPPPNTIVNEALFLPDRAEDINGIIFDPPFGQKTGVHLGNNVIRWTMVWFNTGLAQAATITDTLPPGQTFLGNLNCTAFGASSTTSCTYNPATFQVIWTGTIDQGPPNRVEIAFDVTVPGDGNYNNVATLTTSNGQQAAASAAVVIGGDEDDGQGGGTPGVFLVDPAIVKLVNPRLALPGEVITWTITVTNPNPVSVDNVTVVENMPAEFIIDSVSASRGTVTRSGQRLTISLGTMTAGEQVTIIVQTRLNPRAITTSSVTNVAVLDAPYNKEARATVEIVSRLPETGETPLWRDALLLGLALSLAALGLGAAWRARTR
ncbi:MAG: GEVED domain-containing protein [Anaerolineae bacterium]|nr:GEVED domain-containing protein [Anaerolineae bacterium]MDW8171581.1 SdrD B-like domain-containing protein [Anaerolineae bacterium]